jgi:hypothetical protein
LVFLSAVADDHPPQGVFTPGVRRISIPHRANGVDVMFVGIRDKGK